MAELQRNVPTLSSRNDLPPRRALGLLGGLFLATASLRFLLTFFTPAPHIFTDELQYMDFARSVAAGEGFVFNGIPMDFPNRLYPLLIAPFTAIESMTVRMALIQLLHSLLMAATVPLTYGLAREVTNRRRALAAAGLTGLTPAMAYAANVMTENLFFPVFTLSLWLGYRAALRPTMLRRIMAGLCFGVVFHVKPHGLLIPVIFGLTVLVHEARRLVPQESLRKPIRSYLGAVQCHWLTAVAWMVALVPRIWTMFHVEQAGYPLSWAAFLGAYAELADGKQGREPLEWLIATLALLALGILATGILPAAVLGRSLINMRRAKVDREHGLLFALTAVSTLVVLVVIGHFVDTYDFKFFLFERYTFVVYPLVFIVFCSEHVPAQGRNAGWLFRGLALLLLVAGVVYFSQPAIWSLATNTPSMTGLLFFLLGAKHFGELSYKLAIVFTALTAIIFLTSRGRFWRDWMDVASLLVLFNAGYYGVHQLLVKPMVENPRYIAATIADLLTSSDRLLILDDALERATQWRALFHNAGLIVYLSDREYYFGRPLELTGDGGVISPFELERSWLLAGSNWAFNKAPRVKFSNAALYHVGGDLPLVFNLDQVSAHIKAQDRVDRSVEGDYLSGLKMQLIDVRWPERWVAGKEYEVRIILRNDSVFDLPPGLTRLGLGYHWSDPERTGEWRAIVWDDGRHALLPPGLGTRRSCEVLLPVKAPDEPGERWLLTLVFFQLGTDGEKRWEEKAFALEWIDIRAPG